MKAGTDRPGPVYARGHYGAALLAYAPVGYVLIGDEPHLAIAGGLGVLLFGTVPDVDQRIPQLRHRGPTHSLVGLAAVAAGLAWLGWHGGGVADVGAAGTLDRPAVAAFAAGVGVVGVGSHLLADVITPTGVDLLWPLPVEPVSVALVDSDDVFANSILLVLGTLATGLVWVTGGPSV